MKKQIVFIMNPISGTIRKSNIPTLIADRLDKNKFDYQIKFTEFAGHASEIALELRNKGVDVIVAVGGDGTVNEIGRSIVHSNTALGVIPCGSGNGLARHLLLPMSIKKSIDIINKCDIKELDYGVINEHPFFCTCGMGFDALISKKFAESGRRGPISYAENILREGVTYKSERYVIKDDINSVECNAFVISCANASQYGNNAYIAPDASMSDGLMDVTIIEPFDLFDASLISVDMFNKTLDTNSKVRTFRCKKLYVKREKEGLIHYDGDAVMTSKNVDIRLKCKGIKMIVNPFEKRGDIKINPMLSVAANFLHDLDELRGDINKQGQNLQALAKVIQRKFSI